MATRKRKELGEYVVSDPKICGGDLTFKGTRVLVKDVLYFVAQGNDWDWIIKGYHNSISREAIAESIALAKEALIAKSESHRRAA